MDSNRLQPIPDDLATSIGGAEIVGRPPVYIRIPSTGEVVPMPGRYQIQQDFVTVAQPNPDFYTELSPQQRQKKYNDAFDEAHAIIERQGMGGGTTGLIVGASFDEKQGEDEATTLRLHTANLGDSTAFLIVYDSNGKINREKSRMLNALHEPGNSAEEIRVESENGVITQREGDCPRLNGILACTRSLEGMPMDGLGTRPEYLEETVQLDPGEQAMVIASCDGMLEMLFKNCDCDSSTSEGRKVYRDIALDYISKAISPEELLNGDPRSIAAKLMLQAIKTSTDNISILVQRLLPEKPFLLMGIFDGHGDKGEIASCIAATTIFKSLGVVFEMSKVLIAESKPESINAIRSHFIPTYPSDLSIFEEIKQFLQKTTLDVAEINHIIGLIERYDTYLSKNTSKEYYIQLRNQILITFTLMKDISRNSNLTDHNKVGLIDKEIKDYIVEIEKIVNEERPGCTKQAGVIACRAIGTIAGIVLTPFAPFIGMYRMYKSYLKDKNNPTRGDYCAAVALGFAGFVLGAAAAPLVAMNEGDNLVKKQFQDHYKRLKFSEEVTPVLEIMKSKNLLFSVKAGDGGSNNQIELEEDKNKGNIAKADSHKSDPS